MINLVRDRAPGHAQEFLFTAADHQMHKMHLVFEILPEDTCLRTRSSCVQAWPAAGTRNLSLDSAYDLPIIRIDSALGAPLTPSVCHLNVT